jgi:radical SAM superfamily enzyme YgiQ (UPF0313 family)
LFKVRFVAFGDSDFGWLGLGYLSTALNRLEGVQVSVGYYRPDDVDAACHETVSADPDAIGLPVLQSSLRAVKAFAKKTKSLLPNTHITLGNKEVTAQPELIMQWCDEADSVVVGEGELTFAELVQRLKERRPLSGCAGVYYRHNGEIVRNPNRPQEQDLHAFGYPDRTILPVDNPVIIASESHKIFPVLTARGCTSFCTFCEVGGTSHLNMRARSMADVLNEVEVLVRDHGAPYILFADDSFEDGDPVAGRRFQLLRDEISTRGINFRFFLMCKAKTVNDQTIGLLNDLRRVGLDRLFIGIEAGNEADLKLYGKSSKLSENALALELTAQVGITVSPVHHVQPILDL